MRSIQRLSGACSRAANAAVKHGDDAVRSRLAVVAEPRDALRLPQQIPDGGLVIVAAQRFQIREAEAAPWGTQHGEPSDAVVEVQQRAREAGEILRDGLLAQAVDLDGVHGEPALAQPLA